jgi:hypothetical protein
MVTDLGVGGQGGPRELSAAERMGLADVTGNKLECISCKRVTTKREVREVKGLTGNHLLCVDNIECLRYCKTAGIYLTPDDGIKYV